jgi:hypothetical protein
VLTFAEFFTTAAIIPNKQKAELPYWEFRFIYFIEALPFGSHR